MSLSSRPSTLFLAAQTPQLLRDNLTIKPLFRITGTIPRHGLSMTHPTNHFTPSLWNGELYHITPTSSGSYQVQRLASVEDHGINYLQGLALHDGMVYLVGNVVITQGMIGYGQSRKSENER